MIEEEKFIRFKNRLLGPSFLNDGTHFAQVLGWNDFQFWGYIEEKAPYLPLTLPLSDIAKGQVILERIEIEPSPKRMADLLQAVYNTFAFYSETPKGDYDDHWSQFARWLQSHVESIGFSDMKIRWIKKPEAEYTTDVTHERYYVPGELEITYNGPDWNQEESKRIFENGFDSRVLRDARNAKTASNIILQKERWYKKPFGIVTLSVVGAVIAAGVIYWLGWK